MTKMPNCAFEEPALHIWLSAPESIIATKVN